MVPVKEDENQSINQLVKETNLESDLFLMEKPSLTIQVNRETGFLSTDKPLISACRASSGRARLIRRKRTSPKQEEDLEWSERWKKGK